MKTLYFFIASMFLSAHFLLQPTKAKAQVRVAFHNVENLFDNVTDSTVNYDQFNDNGDHHWNVLKYRKKLMMLFKTYASMEAQRPIAVLGMAEIENKSVLNDLISKTPLVKNNYKIIHYESGDHRGIDVAILYDPEQYFPLFNKAISVAGSEAQLSETRDILYSKGILLGDTVHMFVNHWPSSYSGLMKNRQKRLLVAQILKKAVDSINQISPDAKILVMGDFNEPPDAPALKYLASYPMTLLNPKSVYNKAKGTIKRKSVWMLYDQMIVANSLITGSHGLFVKDKSFYIFDEGFLLEKDNKYSGWKTFRTYQGFKYHGGISDHLPVFIDLFKVKNSRLLNEVEKNN